MTQTGGWWDSPILTHLVAGRRRRILAVLLERSAPVSERRLAVDLVAIEQRTDPGDIAEEELERTRVALKHSHLPALNEVDLVVWDRADEVVATTDHPALEDPRLRYVVERWSAVWDEVVASLVVPRRRVALSVLEAHDEPMSRSTLAREVAMRAADTEPSSAQIRETDISLHHSHLPKLEAAGLVEYDPEAETAAYCGRPDLKETWFDVPLCEPSGAGLEWVTHSSSPD